MLKQPGHLTSIKNERGAGTRVLSLCLRASLHSKLSYISSHEDAMGNIRGRGWIEKVNCENLSRYCQENGSFISMK